MAKILVVDDDKSIVTLLRSLLVHSGYEVVVAMDGKSCLVAAREEKPDLIILDVMMPEMDGFTVSGLLFQDPVMRLIPVIILTVKERPRDMLELVPNIRVYMTKPFDKNNLLHCVRSLLQLPTTPA